MNDLLRRRFAVSLLGALLVSCQGYDAGAPRAAGEDVTLRVGEHRAAAGASVGFTSVTEDSRCPRGVQCITAGRAVARVWIVAGDGDTTWVEVEIPGGVDRPDSAASVPVGADGFTIRLLRLEPYPVADVPADPGSYRATLQVRPGS